MNHLPSPPSYFATSAGGSAACGVLLSALPFCHFSPIMSLQAAPTAEYE
jgi:hypothetical protein